MKEIDDLKKVVKKVKEQVMLTRKMKVVKIPRVKKE